VSSRWSSGSRRQSSEPVLIVHWFSRNTTTQSHPSSRVPSSIRHQTSMPDHSEAIPVEVLSKGSIHRWPRVVFLTCSGTFAWMCRRSVTRANNSVRGARVHSATSDLNRHHQSGPSSHCQVVESILGTVPHYSRQLSAALDDAVALTTDEATLQAGLCRRSIPGSAAVSPPATV